MKSFVVLTYYQLMHAVALTLELGEKTNLYFAPTYLHIEEPFLERIRETKIFNEVVGLYQEEFVVPYVEELKAVKGYSKDQISEIGNSIFEKYLEPHYAKLFKNADFNDDIYVYNDFQRHYYYIAKHFNNIIGVEDGYKSIEQQTRVHWFKGNYKLVEPFLGTYYPEPLYRHSNVKKIITSCDFPEIDQYYREKFEIIDFKQMVSANKAEFLKVMLHIFSLQELKIKKNSVLILGTPIARSKYCNAVQGYLFYKKIIETQLKESEDIHVYIKPHPADTLDYRLFESDRVTVFDKAFPIELLEYRGDRFEKAISLGSTAIMDAICNQNVLLYQGKGTVLDIKKYIQTFTKDEHITFNIYIKVERLTAETYINIFSYLKAYKNINLNVNILVKRGMENEVTNRFQTKYIKKEIVAYKARYKKSKYRAYFCSQIKQLMELENGLPSGVSYKVCGVDSFEDIELYNSIIAKDKFDYTLVIDSNNLGAAVIPKCIKALREDAILGYTFLNYTNMDDSIKQKTFLGNGVVNCYYTNTFENRILHRKVFEEGFNSVKDTYQLDLVMHKNHDRMRNRAIMVMYMSNSRYCSIKNGKDYYFNNVGRLIEDQKNYGISDEVLSGLIAVQVKEYYNWLNLSEPKMVEKLLWRFIESLNIQTAIKQTVLQYCLESFMWERRVRQTKKLCQDEVVYDYSRKIIDKLLQSGAINFLTELINYKKKVKRVIKKIIKKCKLLLKSN